jgi:hypothetical protein
LAGLVKFLTFLLSFFFFEFVVQSGVVGQESTLWADAGYDINLAARKGIGDIGEIGRKIWRERFVVDRRRNGEILGYTV